MSRTRNNAGFTIIELVVVIVILGILAAVALPRFMDASERAHDSSVIATKGALAESVALFKAQWFVNGNSQGDPENDVNGFGGELVDSNESGWPVGTCLRQTGADNDEWDPTTDNMGVLPSAVGTLANCPAAADGNGTAVEDGEYLGSFCEQVWIGLLGEQGPKVDDSGTARTADGDEYSAVATSGSNTCVYEYLPDPSTDSLVGGGSGARTITYDASTGQVTTNVQRFVEEGS